MADSDTFTEEDFLAITQGNQNAIASEVLLTTLSDLAEDNYSEEEQLGHLSELGYLQHIQSLIERDALSSREFLGALLPNDLAALNTVLGYESFEINEILISIVNNFDAENPGFSDYLIANHEPYQQMLAAQHGLELNGVVASIMDGFETGETEVQDYVVRLSNLDFDVYNPARLREILLHNDGELPKYFLAQNNDEINEAFIRLIGILGENNPDFVTSLRGLTPELNRIGVLASPASISTQDLFDFDMSEGSFTGLSEILQNRDQDALQSYIQRAIDENRLEGLLTNDQFRQTLLGHAGNTDYADIYIITNMLAGQENENVRNALQELLTNANENDAEFLNVIIAGSPALQTLAFPILSPQQLYDFDIVSDGYEGLAYLLQNTDQEYFRAYLQRVIEQEKVEEFLNDTVFLQIILDHASNANRYLMAEMFEPHLSAGFISDFQNANPVLGRLFHEFSPPDGNFPIRPEQTGDEDGGSEEGEDAEPVEQEPPPLPAALQGLINPQISTQPTILFNDAIDQVRQIQQRLENLPEDPQARQSALNEIAEDLEGLAIALSPLQAGDPRLLHTPPIESNPDNYESGFDALRDDLHGAIVQQEHAELVEMLIQSSEQARVTARALDYLTRPEPELVSIASPDYTLDARSGPRDGGHAETFGIAAGIIASGETPQGDVPEADEDVPATENDSALPQAGDWLAQLGVYSSSESAQQAWQGLQERGLFEGHDIDMLVERGEIGGNEVFRLRVGPFEDEQSVLEFCAELNSEGVGCVPLVVPEGYNRSALVVAPNNPVAVDAEEIIRPVPRPDRTEVDANPEPEPEGMNASEALAENIAHVTQPRYSEFLDGRGFHNDRDQYTDFNAIQDVFLRCDELDVTNAHIQAIRDHIGTQENFILRTDAAIRALGARNEILENGGSELAGIAAFFEQLQASDFVLDHEDSIDDDSDYDRTEREAVYTATLRFDGGAP